MKRCSSAPSLTSEDTKKTRSEIETTPNSREYLQLALARVLELQREVRDGSYFSMGQNNDSTSDLGESESDEDVLKEVVNKVFHDLPGTPKSIDKIIDRSTRPDNPLIHAIHGKRIQLLGYDTCRRTAIEFMKNTLRENSNRTVRSIGDRSQNIRSRMLKSLDLHLAVKQRDYTVRLMNS